MVPFSVREVRCVQCWTGEPEVLMESGWGHQVMGLYGQAWGSSASGTHSHKGGGWNCVTK